MSSLLILFSFLLLPPFFFKIESYVFKTSLKFVVHPRMTLNVWSSCCHLPSVELLGLQAFTTVHARDQTQGFMHVRQTLYWLHILNSFRPTFHFLLFKKCCLFQNHFRVAVQMQFFGLPQVSIPMAGPALPMCGDYCVNSLAPRSFQSRVIIDLCNINVQWDVYPRTGLEWTKFISFIFNGSLKRFLKKRWVREASAWCEQQLIQRLITDQSTEHKGPLTTQLYTGHLYHPSPRLREHWGSGARKNIRAWEWRGVKCCLLNMLWPSHLWTHYGCSDVQDRHTCTGSSQQEQPTFNRPYLLDSVGYKNNNNHHHRRRYEGQRRGRGMCYGGLEGVEKIWGGYDQVRLFTCMILSKINKRCPFFFFLKKWGQRGQLTKYLSHKNTNLSLSDPHTPIKSQMW